MEKVSLVFTAVFITAMLVTSCGGGNETPSSNEVTIGKQVWMTKNLNVSTFRNGDPIPEVKTDEEWIKAGDYKQPAWCYYDNDPTNGVKYGKLYNWYAVNDQRGLAPVGYHIPSDAEWAVLTGYLGSNAGTKMKSKSGWAEDGNGTNSSGFSGLPGGFRNYAGPFAAVGEYGYWWSCSEDLTYLVWSHPLLYKSGYFYRYYSTMGKVGFSVRCLKDEEPPNKNICPTPHFTQVQEIPQPYARARDSNPQMTQAQQIYDEEPPNKTTLSTEVTIGNQVWMAENLNVAKFRNGDPIPEAKSDEEWEKAGENKQPAWCYYENDPANGTKYGKLYNWYAVSDSRGLAPVGYHIPSDAEWTILTDYLGGAEKAGAKMKSKQGWAEDGNGTNSSGFNGLPGGGRQDLGKSDAMTFVSIGKYGVWWSSKDDTNVAWFRSLLSNTGFVFRSPTNKDLGFSVRCLRD